MRTSGRRTRPIGTLIQKAPHMPGKTSDDTPPTMGTEISATPVRQPTDSQRLGAVPPGKQRRAGHRQRHQQRRTCTAALVRRSAKGHYGWHTPAETTDEQPPTPPPPPPPTPPADPRRRTAAASNRSAERPLRQRQPLRKERTHAHSPSIGRILTQGARPSLRKCRVRGHHQRDQTPP